MQTNITQNSKKNVAVIVAVSLVFGIMIGLGIQTSDAQTGTPNTLTKSYKPQVVCGDRLCSEPQHAMNVEETHIIGEMDRSDPASPSTELISIDKYGPNTYQQDAVTYKITYRLTAGQEDLEDIQIRATTDMGIWDFKISSLNAESSSVNVARVKALDPDSITGEIIGYIIPEL